MFRGKYFNIEKCDNETGWKIRASIVAIVLFSFLFVFYSPLEFIFHRLGFEESNGCPLLTLTSIPCPTCGTGRGIKSIFSLNLAKSYYYNPAAPFLFLISGFVMFSIFVLSFFNYKIAFNVAFFKLWYIPSGLLVLIWILNILYGNHFGSF